MKFSTSHKREKLNEVLHFHIDTANDLTPKSDIFVVLPRGFSAKDFPIHGVPDRYIGPTGSNPGHFLLPRLKRDETGGWTPSTPYN